MFKLITKVSIYLSVMIGCVFIGLIIGYFISQIVFLNPFWQTIAPPTQEKITNILSARLQPDGHVDNLFVQNISGEVYVWIKEPGEKVTDAEWKKIEIMTDEKIIQLLSFSSLPYNGVYIKTDKNYYYQMVDKETFHKCCSWRLITEKEFPTDKFDGICDHLSLFIRPLGSIVSQTGVCMSGSLSNEYRSYILMNDGKLYLLSKTYSIITLFIGETIGLLMGLIIGVILNLTFIKHKILPNIYLQ